MANSTVTKRALAKALKELMAEKPFSRISVSEIAEKCSINRKSFYYHFKDKYDLIDWIFESEFIEKVRKNGNYLRFDFIDDYEVSRALLDAAADWGRQHGMTAMNGPVGFTDFDHQGLLLEGYDYVSPMASLYNYPYYVDHFDRYGLVKEADWIEFLVSTPHQIPEKMERVAKIVMEKYKIRIDKVRTVKELKEKYGYSYFDVIDAAYQPLYNFQPLTQRQKEYYAEMYFPLINFDFITIAINEHDEIVGVGIGMPDISKALQETRGKLFPFGWIKLLKALKAKQMDTFNLLLIAVRPDYQNKGVNALFFYDQIPYFQKYGIKYTETTAILEENSKNQANFAYFETKQHKRRRAYIKSL